MRKILLVSAVLAMSMISLPTFALSKQQEEAIVEHCSAINDALKAIQRVDSKTRVYLGGYYESVLSKFIMPLNVRLIENNLSTAAFVENQNKFADTRTLFSNDFISYQQSLEDLVSVDCKTEPKVFYEKLEKVRQKRKVVGQDVIKLRSLISEHLKLVNGLKGKL